MSKGKTMGDFDRGKIVTSTAYQCKHLVGLSQ